MKKISIWLLLVLSCIYLTGCGTSKEAKSAREAGIEYLDQKDYARALDSFETALYEAGEKVGSFHLDVLKYRAEAEYGLEDYAAAAHTYDTLIQADEQRAEYLFLRSLARGAMGQWKEAVADYELGMATDPKADFAYQSLLTVGEACEKAGQLDKAMALYKGAQDSEMADGLLYQRMGNCLLGQKAYDQALAYFQTGIGLNQEESLEGLLFSQAVAYEYLGEFSKALKLFEDYVTQYGPSPEAEKEIAFLKTR